VNAHYAKNRAVVVLATDRSDMSEHLIAMACELIDSYSEVELHVVRRVPRSDLAKRLVTPADLRRIRAARTADESVSAEPETFCGAVASRSGARLIVHAVAGDVSDELERLARELAADVIIMNADCHWGAGGISGVT